MWDCACAEPIGSMDRQNTGFPTRYDSGFLSFPFLYRNSVPWRDHIFTLLFHIDTLCLHTRALQIVKSILLFYNFHLDYNIYIKDGSCAVISVKCVLNVSYSGQTPRDIPKISIWRIKMFMIWNTFLCMLYFVLRVCKHLHLAAFIVYLIIYLCQWQTKNFVPRCLSSNPISLKSRSQWF